MGKIKSPEDLEKLYSKLKYRVLNKDTNRPYFNTNFDTFNNWHLLSPEQIKKHKIGICYDTAAMTDAVLNELGIEHENRFAHSNTDGDWTQDPTHAYNIYKDKDGNWRWIEGSWGDYKGNDWTEKKKEVLLRKIKKALADAAGKKQTVHKVDKFPEPGIAMQDFYAEMLKNPVKKAEEIDPKKLARARKFVDAVNRLAKKKGLNFFLVTDGASGISNNGNPAVRSAREAHIKWELEHGSDPYEDWSKKAAYSLKKDPTYDDVAEVFDRLSFEDRANIAPRHPDFLRDVPKEMLFDRQVVVDENGNPVGFNEFYSMKDKAGRRLPPHNSLGVVQEARGNGLAKLMVEQAIRKAKKEKIRRLVWEAFADNEPSIRAALSSGFEDRTPKNAKEYRRFVYRISDDKSEKNASAKKETYTSGSGKVVSFTKNKTTGHDEIVIQLKNGKKLVISNNTLLGKPVDPEPGSELGFNGYQIDGTNIVHKVHPNKHQRGGWLEHRENRHG